METSLTYLNTGDKMKTNETAVTLRDLTLVRGEVGASLMAVIGAFRLITHVLNGGFLGCNAEHYALGIVDKDGKVLQSGWDIFKDEEIEQAFKLALLAVPDLWELAEDNFHKEEDMEDY
jgi:hypothetical protein